MPEKTVDPEQVKSFATSEGKITKLKAELKYRQSTARLFVQDCAASTEEGVVDTTSGDITVQGYASPTYPPYAHYELTELRALDGSGNQYNFVNGPQHVRPGRYRHTVRGRVETWGDCHGKLFQVISEILY